MVEVSQVLRTRGARVRGRRQGEARRRRRACGGNEASTPQPPMLFSVRVPGFYSHTLHVHRKHSRTTEIQRDPSRWSTRPNVPCFRSPEPSLSVFIHSQHILFSRPLLFLATIASPCHALYILPSLVVYHTNHALCSRHSATIGVVRIEGREGKGGKK